MVRATVFAAAALSAVVACSQSVRIALQADVPAKVYILGSQAERTLLPGSAGHKHLSQWVEANQSGWRPYPATPPAIGVVVRAASLDLQFMEHTVLLHSTQGLFSKSVEPNEYSFLAAQSGS